jgi:hypothetical protein
MPRLLAAALFALCLFAAAPAAAQDLLARDAKVNELTVDTEVRGYPATEAGGAAFDAQWRVIRGLGNCCETYLTTDGNGRLFDYGGNYINFSDDRGETWREARPPEDMLGGEGAIVAGPNGDIYGVGWDPYTGDTLISMRYSAQTQKWQTARMPLHSPFYDREWISYVPGPIEIDGDTFPFVIFVKGGFPSKEEWLYSTDGLTYASVSSKALESEVNGSVKEPVAVQASPAFDVIQANGNMGLTPLGNGKAIAAPDSSFASEYHLLRPDLSWTGYSFPDGIAGQIHTDSRGRLHNVVADDEPETGETGNRFEYRMSEDGGRTFRAVKVKLPAGFRLRDYDFRVNGALGVAVVGMRAAKSGASGGGGGTSGILERDLLYKIDVRGGQPALLRSYDVGLGDLVTGASAASTDPRFDFESVVLFPDGRAGISFMDSETGGQPAIAVEVGEPFPSGWKDSSLPGLGPIAGPPTPSVAAPPATVVVDAAGPRGKHRVKLVVRRLRGGRVRVKGEVLPRHPGHAVRVERRRGKRWVTVAKLTAGKRSTFSRTLKLRGRQTLRAVAVADGSGHEAGISRAVKLRR